MLLCCLKLHANEADGLIQLMANDQLSSFSDVSKSLMTLSTPLNYYGIMILRKIGLAQIRSSLQQQKNLVKIYIQHTTFLSKKKVF